MKIIMKNLIFCHFIFLFAACSFLNKDKTISKSSKNESVFVFEKKKAEEKKQDDKDLEKVISKKIKNKPLFSKENKKDLQKLAALELKSLPENLSEEEMYETLYRKYEKNSEPSFKIHLNYMLTKFKNGYLADDSLYLAGLFYLSRKEYGIALKYYNQVLVSHPLSNKIPLAQFAKAATLRKMNLLDEAKSAFENVINKYPGSPEAIRARTELRLIQM